MHAASTMTALMDAYASYEAFAEGFIGYHNG